jgi:hypothetical protein
MATAPPKSSTGATAYARRIPAVLWKPAWVVELTTLSLLTAGIAVAYSWTKAPLYNQRGTIDPWLYTALWTNFQQTYETFRGTYYISRIPWIVPGYALNGVFDARIASLVLHTGLAVGGGLLFYVLCRRYVGAVAAAIGYTALLGNQMYFNAHRWDYPEGGVVAFLIAAYAFALPLTMSPPVRLASLAASGFIAAALVTTRTVDAAFLVGLPILHFTVYGSKAYRLWLRLLVRDLAAFFVGAVVLLGAAGAFARAHGEEFLFFMPQLRYLQSTSGETFHRPPDQWLPFEPYFWLPVFATLLAVVVLLTAPHSGSNARRFLIGTTAWLAISFIGFAFYEFAGTGWFFEYSFYFSSFLVPTYLSLSASIAVLLGVRPITRRAIPLLCACAAAVLLPLAVIYRSDSFAHVANGYWSRPYVVATGAMALAIVLVLTAEIARVRAASAMAAVVAVFAVSQAVDSSLHTRLLGASDERTGDVYSLSQELVDHLKQNGYGDGIPYFWYSGAAREHAFVSLQSLYYYSYTYIGVAMPKIDADFRFRMQLYRPSRLVLLCADARCERGSAEAALRRAGFMPHEVSRRRLAVGGEFVWVAIYSVRSTV